MSWTGQGIDCFGHQILTKNKARLESVEGEITVKIDAIAHK